MGKKYETKENFQMTGKIYLVGIGPGNADDMTRRAAGTIKTAAVVIGHKSCLDLIPDLTAGKEIIADDLSPVERAEIAVRRALAGASVAMVTTGDPGVYAIASTLFSWLQRESLKLNVVVVPGLPAANVASALLGSPLGYDFATISLTDKGTPWHEITARIKAAAGSGFVIVFYNPIGKVGDSRLKEAISVIGESLPGSVPVGIVADINGEAQKVKITTLDQVLTGKIDDQSLIIIGNTKTFVFEGRMITPRKYVKGIGY
jgi:precorrin-3B C17-methyltransferase